MLLLITCLFAIRFILCPLPALLCIVGAYISQARLLTGFLISSAKGRQERKVWGKEEERSQNISLRMVGIPPSFFSSHLTSLHVSLSPSLSLSVPGGVSSGSCVSASCPSAPLSSGLVPLESPSFSALITPSLPIDLLLLGMVVTSYISNLWVVSLPPIWLLKSFYKFIVLNSHCLKDLMCFLFS